MHLTDTGPLPSGIESDVGLSLGRTAVYRLVVQGAVAEQLSDRLGELEIRTSCGAHGSTTTTLTGRIRDQAQLIGVVNSLYEMRFPILAVELLELE